MQNTEACLVCGAELEYFVESREMVCSFCRRTVSSNAACRNGHFVCDACHERQALSVIREIALKAVSHSPMEIALEMMRDPHIHMHGPENHVLVGSALLAAYRNAGGTVELDTALSEMEQRGRQVPGGICGLWGCCGAAVSAGIFVSIVTGSTPLAVGAFGLSNQMTAAALTAIGAVGGPRCCKRNAFLSIEQAVQFCREHLQVDMSEKCGYICEFHERNRECIGKRCSFSGRSK